ncbi:MAG TPA: HAD family hydrolase [Rectinemataceae bacterium]|nr:HAD family hydrolase [Rectinemataceae bacterium]
MRQGHPLLVHRQALASEGFAPPWVALFDIDSTLMDTSRRNLAILEAAAAELPVLRSVWERLDRKKASWNIVDPLREAGFDDPAVIEHVQAFWQERFFTDEWVQADEPYPGVAEFLADLKEEGFRLAYLTGRHRDGMEAGTRTSFLRHGLPAGSEERFFFKPDFHMGDLEFKTEVCRELESLGTLVLAVDNEPANANLFRRRFPGAMIVWLDTVTSPSPETLLPGIGRSAPSWFLDR